MMKKVQKISANKKPTHLKHVRYHLINSLVSPKFGLLGNLFLDGFLFWRSSLWSFRSLGSFRSLWSFYDLWLFHSLLLFRGRYDSKSTSIVCVNITYNHIIQIRCGFFGLRNEIYVKMSLLSSKINVANSTKKVMVQKTDIFKKLTKIVDLHTK